MFPAEGFTACDSRSPDIRASVIVLTKNGEKYLRSVLSALYSQRGIDRTEVIVIDSGSSDGTLTIASEFPVLLRRIPAHEFGHGKTRNLGARLSRGEFLVYLPQDATPLGEDWLDALLRPFDDPAVAGVHCRQVARPDASAMERFFLQDTYPERFDRRTLQSPEKASLSSCFFSTVGGAIRASLWNTHPFREDVIMSEDQAWARDVMRCGRSIVYQPAAAVLHSHQYSIAEVFRRNFDSGFSVRQIYDCNTGIPTTRIFSLLLRETVFVVAQRRVADMLRFPLYELSRHLGFWLGMHAERLPVRLRRACGNLSYFWDQHPPAVSRTE